MSFVKNSEAIFNLTDMSFFFFFWLRWVFVDAHGLFSSCCEWGLFFVVVRGLLIAVASCCGAQVLGSQASVVAARGLSSCGARA